MYAMFATAHMACITRIVCESRKQVITPPLPHRYNLLNGRFPTGFEHALHVCGDGLFHFYLLLELFHHS